jgi:hypothetical protein
MNVRELTTGNVRELTTGAQKPITRSPFVGTRPFFRTDAPFFFGREREAARLANIVSACTMAVLYGESGVGKSSLLNARLPLSLEEIEPGWSVISFFDWQPGFEARFLKLINDEIGVTTGNAFARPLLQYAQDTKAPLLLVLDQFEEYFLYNPTGNDLFEAELAKLVNRRASAVRVLFSLRSDGLFLLDRLRLRIPDVFGRMMLIEPLNAEAAADCIIHPIEAFNATSQLPAVTVPDRKSELVNALVYGAEEREIRRRLPNPGRAELEFDRTRPPRIVAPFLQMALEAIWEEDVIKKQRSELTLNTLCSLAATNTKVQDPLKAVGHVAQSYVDSILKPFNAEQKSVCGLIFERMVLPSGQKVAVKLADVEQFLPDKQKGKAEPILIQLSESPRARLIRKVAPGPGEVDPHFQIVHDAMAVPILNWIEEWRRGQREREAAHKLAKERKFTVLWSCLTAFATLLLGLAVGAAKVLSINSGLERFASVIQYDTRPQFRLPLLLGSAGLSVAEGTWWFPIKASTLETAMRSTLLRSPRDGGFFSAAGFDPKEGKVAFLHVLRKQIIVCDLAHTKFCDPTPVREGVNREGADAIHKGDAPQDYVYALEPPELPTFQSDKINPRFLQNRQYSIGFIDGFNEPVIHWQGFLYYKAEGNWQAPYDISKSLLGLDDSRPGSVFVEIIDGGLRVTINDWPRNRMWITRLVANPNARKDAPLLSNNGKWLPVNWTPGYPPPAISPNAEFAGSMSLVPDGQKAKVVLKLTSERGAIDQPLATIEGSLPSPSWPSIGFTYDSNIMAVLSTREATFRNLGDNNDFHTLKLGQELNPGPLGGSAFSLPPLALMKPDSEMSRWRLAWRARNGIEVLASDGRASLTSSRPPLLTDSDSPFRVLTFSKDGAFLFAMSQRFDGSMAVVRVWDLRASWSEMVNSMKDRSDLKNLACRVAGIAASETRGKNFAAFTENEMREWGIGQQPCELLAR